MKGNNNMTNTLEITSTTLANKAMKLEDLAYGNAFNASMLTIAALVAANSDTVFEYGVTIGDYYQYESKLQKMNWRSQVMEKVFSMTGTIEERYKQRIDYILPIVSVLIKYGYQLHCTDVKVSEAQLAAFADSKHIVLNLKQMQMYLPKGIAIVNSKAEAVLDKESLTLVNANFGAIANHCKKMLGVTANKRGGNNTTYAKTSSEDSGTSNDSNTTTTLDNTASGNMYDTTLVYDSTVSVTKLLQATLHVVETQELTQLSSDERKCLYSIFQNIAAQLSDDAIKALLDNNNPIDLDNSKAVDKLTKKAA